MPRPRKRRKIEPKIRTTQHLDLTSDTSQSKYDRDEALESLLHALRKRRKIVVVAGAGISVSAGIPDFRSSHGLFRSLRGEHKLKGSGKELFDASVYKNDSATSSFHDMVGKLSTMSANAKPTPFHRLIARLAKEDRLLRLYTQNVDGLENDLEPLKTSVPLNHKAPWPRTIQLHGGLEKMMCQKCRHISDFQAELFDGPEPPSCPECVAHDALRTTHAGKRSHGVGRLRPRIVLYNEQNPDDEAIGAVTTADFRTRPDAVIVVGTSMKIPTVRRIVHEMCRIVRDRREGTTVWINRDPVPTGKDLEDCWDLIVQGDCDEIARLADFKEWDDDTPEVVEPYTDSDFEKIPSSQDRIKVMVQSPKKGRGVSEIDEIKTEPVEVKKEPTDVVYGVTPPMSPKPEVVENAAIPSKLSFIIKIPPAKKPTEQRLENPASKYKSLNSLLSQPQVNSKSKTSQNNKPGRPTKTKAQPAQSMKSHFKTTKNVSQPTSAIKSNKPLAPSHGNVPLHDYQHPAPHVNIQRLQDSRDATPEGMMVQTPPNHESKSSTPVPEQRRTISPTGYVPSDIRKMLNDP